MFGRFLRVPKPVPILLGIAGAVLVAKAAQAFGVEGYLERQTDNARFSVLPKIASKQKIVIVEVSDAALRRWREPSNFWTARYARVIDRLRECNVKWIGVDMIFSADVDHYLEESGIQNPGYDRKLETALKRVRTKVTLAEILGGTGLQGQSIQPIAMIGQVTGNSAFIDIDFSNSDEKDIPLGNRTNLNVDDVPRTLPIAVHGADGSFPSFSLAIAARSKGIDPNEIAVQDQLGKGALIYGVNYRFNPFDTVDAALLESDAKLPARMNDLLKDAIVIIGTKNRSTRDVWQSPSGGKIFGVHVQALGVATLLNGNAISRINPPNILLVAAIAALFLWFVPLWLGIPLLLTIATALWIGAVQALSNSNIMIPVGAPWLALIAGAIGAYGVKAIFDAAQREHIERVFGANVSPQIRDLLLASPENLKLGGRSIEGSVLFVDMRNSVGLAYNRNPEDVMSDLNSLFGAIVPPVQRHGGVLSRFTGDGFFALFGAPIASETHASDAIAAAKEIVKGIHELNEKHPDRPLKIGCGINTGLIVCGNIGTESRSEFTAIGDTVNVAARIESLTKIHGVDILISESTLEFIPDRSPYGPAIESVIPGRNDEVIVLFPLKTQVQS